VLAIGGLIIFAGYTVGSYGRILLKGWNITFRQWVNPLNPYHWPSGAVPTIPDTQVFPGGTSSAPAQTGGAALGGSVAGVVQDINQLPPSSFGG